MFPFHRFLTYTKVTLRNEAARHNAAASFDPLSFSRSSKASRKLAAIATSSFLHRRRSLFSGRRNRSYCEEGVDFYDARNRRVAPCDRHPSSSPAQSLREERKFIDLRGTPARTVAGRGRPPLPPPLSPTSAHDDSRADRE